MKPEARFLREDRLNRARVRRTRNRVQDELGIAMPSIPVFDLANIAKLISSGNLTDAEALIPGNVVACYAEIIADFFHTSERDKAILKSAGRVPRGRRKRA